MFIFVLDESTCVHLILNLYNILDYVVVKIGHVDRGGTSGCIHSDSNKQPTEPHLYLQCIIGCSSFSCECLTCTVNIITKSAMRAVWYLCPHSTNRQELGISMVVDQPIQLQLATALTDIMHNRAANTIQWLWASYIVDYRTPGSMDICYYMSCHFPSFSAAKMTVTCKQIAWIFTMDSFKQWANQKTKSTFP